MQILWVNENGPNPPDISWHFIVYNFVSARGHKKNRAKTQRLPRQYSAPPPPPFISLCIYLFLIFIQGSPFTDMWSSMPFGALIENEFLKQLLYTQIITHNILITLAVHKILNPKYIHKNYYKPTYYLNNFISNALHHEISIKYNYMNKIIHIILHALQSKYRPFMIALLNVFTC